MIRIYQIRRTIVALIALIGFALTVSFHPDLQKAVAPPQSVDSNTTQVAATGDAAAALDQIAVKGRAPKTDYSRTQFGDGWATLQGCDMRNIILHRDLKDIAVDEKCRVTSGVLNDPYTGQTIQFTRGEFSSQAVQIDHVVALSNAWQTGAQSMTPEKREAFANDPLELLAVDGPTNQEKSDADAATWLPPNKAFRCQYVARQIAIKLKYGLWVTSAERDAMKRVLTQCPGQPLSS